MVQPIFSGMSKKETRYINHAYTHHTSQLPLRLSNGFGRGGLGHPQAPAGAQLGGGHLLPEPCGQGEVLCHLRQVRGEVSCMVLQRNKP